MKFPRTSTVKGNTWLREEAIKRMMSFLHENLGAAFGPLFGKKLRAVKVLSTMTSVLRNLGTKGEASLVRSDSCSLQDIRWWRILRRVRMYDNHPVQGVLGDSEQGYKDRQKSLEHSPEFKIDHILKNFQVGLNTFINTIKMVCLLALLNRIYI